MSTAPPRVILDCNILFQAFLSPDGPAAACLALVQEKEITLVCSRDVLIEARGVLNRPFVREKVPSATPEAYWQSRCGAAEFADLSRRGRAL